MMRLSRTRNLACRAALVALVSSSAAIAPAAEETEPPQQRPARRGEQGGVYKTQIAPHWFANNARFWYRNNLRDGAKEFIIVDAERGIREPAFDHSRLASALGKAMGTNCAPDKLPFDAIEFIDGSKAIRFDAGSKTWKCTLDNYECSNVADGPKAELPPESLPAQTRPRPSRRTGPETQITFENRLKQPVEIFWMDTDGRRESYGRLEAGASRDQHTFGGHVWLVTNERGDTLAVFEATDNPGLAVIDDSAPRRTQPEGRRRREEETRSDRSPDGKWTAFVKDHNLFIKSADDEAKEIQLSTDGREGLAYGRFSWSPDSRTLVAFRIEPGERKEVYLVQSSPPGGGRAKLQTRPYTLPGDKFTTYELNLFDVTSRRQIKPEVDRFEHEWLAPRLHWKKDRRHFAYEKVDRGHQRLRVIQVDAQTGNVRNLVDERAKTFLWTAHTENLNLSLVNWLEQTDDIIYASESNGWRHLYLIDGSAGELKNPITTGDWVVRGIDRIDETNRQVWFRASGVLPDQDPYLVHYGRVDFDGSNLTFLTAGNGNHSIQFSPDRRFIIDTYSRVDLPPVNELRRVSDGKFICQLEQADISEVKSIGWSAPEVFVAKGRDGKTDIWGTISRPRDFDPSLKYPVIEDIYAGPQGSFVPKTFSAGSRYESLTRLGFVVVKIDGMGTANRSKAFHDVCWHNLKDAGFEDRILWMKAAAKKYPSLDLTRVGVYGNSAGGQNAAAAVLFHPEFYRAAVASCGCHDNRMDKASWNEQWMGYPVGPQYSECSNIDNAHRLRGKLFLIVGEMDNNVPPESTMRFADALIKAGKDFDLLVIPNGGHGMGGAYGQRRMHDFFVRYLQGREPPDRNASDTK